MLRILQALALIPLASAQTYWGSGTISGSHAGVSLPTCHEGHGYDNGDMWNLNHYKHTENGGQKVVTHLGVSANWCPPCVASQQSYGHAHELMAPSYPCARFTTIMIDGSVSECAVFATHPLHGSSGHLVFDENSAQLGFHFCDGIPAKHFINENLEVKYSQAGSIGFTEIKWRMENMIYDCGEDCDGYANLPQNQPVDPAGYETDLESHPEESWICQEDANFIVWPGGAPGGQYDVQVIHDSQSKALFITQNPVSDIVLEFGQVVGLSGEHFNFEMDVMILPTHQAYMNFQADAVPGTTWAFEMMFSAGTIDFFHWGNEPFHQASSPVDGYFNFRLEADFTSGTWEVFVDGSSQGTFSSMTPVASANFYAATNCEYYIDNIKWDNGMTAATTTTTTATALMGDLNEDGSIDVLDIVLMVNIVLGGGDYVAVADLNGDNAVDVLDIVSAINIILSGKK